MTHSRAVFLMILVTLLWSMAGVVTRHLDAARGFEVTFWRSAFNALALAVALTYMRGPALWRELLHYPRVVWVSGICWSIMFTGFMMALTLTSVAKVLVMMALAPLITALFARYFLNHRLPYRTWFAIAVGGFGMAWMFGQEARDGVPLLGALVALTVPIAAAVNFTILQYVGHGSGDPDEAAGAPTQDMLPAVLIGALISAAVTLPLAWPLQASTHDMGLLGFLGVAQLAIPCLLLVRLSRVLPAPEIALLGLLEVIFGIAWVWIGAGEQPTDNTMVGGALVIGALVFNEAMALRQQRSIAAAASA
ncbi:MAG: DMT family transporter [Gammaproteobacteria bacterium]|nr:DMT family transporter [Rhodocyclaceae bacterium]MBU3909948.1 DMT family transporter [Gammaproteobacteria bacterium]MBU3987890.1 DMT family transporter [Gammaproteobacteria bacterium]MBU4003921.1 DMT family transporter [Gammaproteobacteria bacterium]MBU4020168.1 DMT family transporter [Gammaproteobacteria bacterium]